MNFKYFPPFRLALKSPRITLFPECSFTAPALFPFHYAWMLGLIYCLYQLTALLAELRQPQQRLLRDLWGAPPAAPSPSSPWGSCSRLTPVPRCAQPRGSPQVTAAPSTSQRPDRPLPVPGPAPGPGRAHVRDGQTWQPFCCADRTAPGSAPHIFLLSQLEFLDAFAFGTEFPF